MSENTMTPEDSGSGTLTVSQAANAFEGLMDTPANSAEQLAGEQEAQEQAQEQEAEPQQEEEIVDDNAEVQEDDSQEDEPSYVVKAAGEEKEVPLSELIKGYQLGADYTKKTTEVAEQRKAVEAERQAIEEAKYARDSYAQRLQAIDNYLTSQVPQEDLSSLKENDPIGYAVKVAELSEKKEQLLAIRAEQARIAQEQQSDYARAMSERVAQEASKLAQVLPEFSDPAKGDNFRKEIRNYGKTLGFSDEELSSVIDSRHVVTLHKAMMYDKLQKSKPAITKKVNEAPRLMRAGTSGSSKESEAQRVNKQKAQLRSSGKVKDAAALFEQFLE
ncbi:hypothetical protein UFOVP89_35 [uncultured Caudovirales phage]|uniref:Scaffolding protein n=1 Tax=uncultured Caudovirales phage TaxID=2100421 RepID=A0A6J5L2Z9_9CAUD|nr:hypothetical protein UFOVP89_35 [uncultured Caudovirales phage]